MMGRSPIGLVFAFFLLTRLLAALLFNMADNTDYYRHYADRIRVETLPGVYRSDLETVEYPQLSMAAMMAAGRLADVLPDSAARLVSYHKLPPQSLAEAKYRAAFTILMFAVDLGIVQLVRWFAILQGVAPGNPVFVYTLSGFLFSTLIYDRLDLPVGGFAILAVILFRLGWYRAAVVALTVGTAFKLVPALLLPIVVFASAIMRTNRHEPLTSLVRATVREILVAVPIFLVWPVSIYLWAGGDRAFSYLDFHSARGLEIESIYAWPVLLATDDTLVTYEYNSHTLRGPLADRVAKLSSVVLAASLLASYALIAVSLVRAWRRTTDDPLDSSRALTSQVVTASVLVWMAFILAGKVASPQYGMWLVPFVSFIPGPRRVAIAFIAMCLIFTAVYPGLFYLVSGPIIQENPKLYAGPTTMGYALLIVRTVAVAAMTAIVAKHLFAREPVNREGTT